MTKRSQCSNEYTFTIINVLRAPTNISFIFRSNPDLGVLLEESRGENPIFLFKWTQQFGGQYLFPQWVTQKSSECSGKEKLISQIGKMKNLTTTSHFVRRKVKQHGNFSFSFNAFEITVIFHVYLRNYTFSTTI
jgi:hypothetical protein